MARHFFLKRKVPSIWPFLLGLTFMCCCLIIFNVMTQQDYRYLTEKGLDGKAGKLNSDNCKSICSIPECIEIANNLIQNIKQDEDPCEDFHEFSCGNFHEKFGRNSDTSTLGSLLEKLYLIIRDVIETSEDAKVVGSAAEKLKIVFDSCINKRSSELEAIKSIQALLSSVGIANWPHLDLNFTFANSNLMEILAKLASHEEDIFVHFFLSFREQYYSGFGHGLMPNISTVYPQNPEPRSASENKHIEKTVKNILNYIGVESENVRSIAEGFMEIEEDIQELHKNNSEINGNLKNSDENRPPGGTIFNCTKDGYLVENIYCKILYSVMKNASNSSIFVPDKLYITHSYSYFIHGLPKILEKYSDRSLAHYIALSVFINNLKTMGFHVRQNVKSEGKSMFIHRPDIMKDESMDQWKFCIDWLTKEMLTPLGNIFIKDMWQESEIGELDSLFNQVMQATSIKIQSQEFLPNDLKQQCKEEVEGTTNVFKTVLDTLQNGTLINEKYKKFQPTPDSFMENVLNLKKFHFENTRLCKKDMLSSLKKFTPFAVGATSGGSEISLFFGMLLPPLFKPTYTKLFNLAGIGQIIGHEFGHIYFTRTRDDEKILLDIVNEQDTCLVNQYSHFEVKRVHEKVDGNMTLNDNFPDQMAIKVVEMIAQNELLNMNADIFALPGMKYSLEQLFYIYYAQPWCTALSIEVEKLSLESDGHSPSEFRIIGPLQNSARFSEVFECSSNAYMNPEKKCSIFD